MVTQESQRVLVRESSRNGAWSAAINFLIIILNGNDRYLLTRFMLRWFIPSVKQAVHLLNYTYDISIVAMLKCYNREGCRRFK